MSKVSVFSIHKVLILLLLALAIAVVAILAAVPLAQASTIEAAGRLYGWGWNAHGQVGSGLVTDEHSPIRLPGPPTGVRDWNDGRLYVFDRFNYFLALDGRLFVWGRNVEGQLGLGDFDDRHLPYENTNFLPDLTNWNGVEFFAHGWHTLARTPDGRLYGWGENVFGNLGIGTGGTNANVHTPVEILLANTDIPTASTYVSSWNDLYFAFGNHHTFAITPDGKLFVWGRNAGAQLGLGHIDSVWAPVENTNLPIGVADWNDMEIFPGPHHTLARVRPLLSPLLKTLQLNEGTTIPNPIPDFIFNFERRQIPLNDAVPPRMSRPIAEVPTITNQTVAVDTSTPITAGGITELRGGLNLWTLVEDALATIPNLSGGIFVWEITELPSVPTLHNPPTAIMAYDQSRFQIRAHTNRYGELVAIEAFRMVQVSGNWQIQLPKLEDGITFVNTYTRTVGTNERAALYISKNVVGEMANLSTPFSFTLTLTNPALSTGIGTVTAEIVNATTGASFSPPRNVNLTAGTNPAFTLAHNEKLRIPTLPAGTRFSVTEAARAQFMPEATVTGIPVLPATGTYPQQAVDTQLATGTYIIHQTELNRASFTNTYVWDVPAGLLITSTPWAALGVVALLLTLLATTRNRKRIEEIPLVM